MKTNKIICSLFLFCLFVTASFAQQEFQKLTASDGAEDDGFGASVFVSGDYAIVGAPLDNGDSSGSAYVFERQNGSWVEVVKLTASDGVEYDVFGASVSISGDYAIIAASGACFFPRWKKMLHFLK